VNHVRSATLDDLVAAIAAVAPDVVDEIAELDRDVDLFEEFGLDSMDRLNIMTALSEVTGCEISERQYPELTSINQLMAHLGGSVP
jgi:acyl carrier protein